MNVWSAVGARKNENKNFQSHTQLGGLDLDVI